jgi:hypothetical protein
MTAQQESRSWSPMEDFVLESLVGKASYQMIALRLGRAPSAVQRRASAKGYSARERWRADKTTRRAQLDALDRARLTASEDDLAAYL